MFYLVFFCSFGQVRRIKYQVVVVVLYRGIVRTMSSGSDASPLGVRFCRHCLMCVSLQRSLGCWWSRVGVSESTVRTEGCLR